MQKIAHVLALLTAWFMWQKIGGIGGLFLAALAIGFIEVLFVALLGLLAAPFGNPPPESPAGRAASQPLNDAGQKP